MRGTRYQVFTVETTAMLCEDGRLYHLGTKLSYTPLTNAKGLNSKSST